MKKICLCLLLTAALTMSANALEVPTSTVVQNLNGSQQVVKTYTVSPEVDARTLIEEPFQLEGFLYTYADIVKEENLVSERQIHTETVTVETGSHHGVWRRHLGGHSGPGSHQHQYPGSGLHYRQQHGDGHQDHRSAGSQ